MAASKSFSFEDGVNVRGSRRPNFNDDFDAGVEPTPKGGIPDFRSFGNIDLAVVSPAIGVLEANQKYTPMSRGAEYMFDEEERERGFGENLVFYTGASYIAGFGGGTALGFFEGLRKGKNLPQNLRMNAIINACSKRGQTIGNNMGVVALMFTTFERLSLYARDKDDAFNAINSAAMTGGLFKSTCGIRQSLSWAIIGGLGMTLVTLSGHASTILHRAKEQTISISESSDKDKK